MFFLVSLPAIAIEIQLSARKVILFLGKRALFMPTSKDKRCFVEQCKNTPKLGMEKQCHIVDNSNVNNPCRHRMIGRYRYAARCVGIQGIGRFNGKEWHNGSYDR